jgi:hypothetical protein
MHFPEDGHVRVPNVWVVYSVYNTLSYTYMHILALISYVIAQYTVMDHLKLIAFMLLHCH